MARRYLASLYDHRIKDIKDVLDRLVFQTYDAETPFNTLVFTVFQFRFLRWLRGVGHPHGCRGGVVDAALYDSQINDPLIRANLLVLAMSDSNLLPGDPWEKYIVCSC